MVTYFRSWEVAGNPLEAAMIVLEGVRIFTSKNLR